MMKHMFMLTVVGLAFCGGSAHALYPIFDTPVEYTGSAIMKEVVAVDLDGDGDLDLATANRGSGYVSTLLNNGDGTFAYRLNHYLGTLVHGYTDIAASDLDGDGDMDLAISRMFDPYTVVIMLNNGDATFESPVHYVVDDGARAVFAADLDGDYDNDLVTANWDYSTVSVLLNNGDGTFQAAATISAGAGAVSGAEDVVAADFDGDGDRDLAVAHGSGNSVYILFNNGDATFAEPLTYAAGGFPGEIRQSDLDADGDRDLVMSLPFAGEVSVLQNNGDGSFQAAALYPVGDEPHGVFVADLDHDGYDDLMTSNFQSDDASVLWNNGDGTFSAADSYVTGSILPNAITASDLDGDGNLDLVVAHYQTLVDAKITVLLSLLPPSQPCNCCTLAPGDLNGDSHTDIADLIYLVDFMFLSGPPPICQ